MDQGYEMYCLADRSFYDSPTAASFPAQDFALAKAPAPEGWRQETLDDWLVCLPPVDDSPTQGWKIHASACLDNAEKVLSTVWEYCVANGIAFKFIRGLELLFLRNSKYADRGSSGKFITIYPRDDAQFELILQELGELLEGEPGPYILSDLRWGDGPLYARYGGFQERHCIGPNGELELAICDENGEFVPDRRDVTFHLPPWVTLPDCLAPHLEARNSVKLDELPYTIERSLHFSNGGGVYAGKDRRTGDKVVLKEARPHAGLAVDRADAVTRLDREREMLERLAGLGVVPEVRDHFALAGHHFLVQDFVEGASLQSRHLDRLPLLALEMDEAEAAAYVKWVVETCGALERAVDAVHGRGIRIGDLHPDNVIVTSDGRPVLIDLEIASPVEEGRRPTMGDPAFVAPPDRAGFEVDHYALAALRLYLFLPLTTLIGLDLSKAEELAAEIAAMFPVPESFLAEAVEVITGEERSEATGQATTNGARPGGAARRRSIEPDADGWRRARDSMHRAILSSVTPERDDRLFPGDPRQFSLGGLGIAYGAAGVLYALAATGAARHPEHEEWLVQRATHPEPGTRVGFYDGLHGVAYVLDYLGRRDEALEVMDICSRELEGKWTALGQDLQSGLAGIGLNLAHFAEVTGDDAFWGTAQEVAGIVADRLGEEDSVPEVSGGVNPYAGLIRGSSGPALLFLRLYERTRDSALLDLAELALRQDLRRCETTEAGTLEVDEGWRTMPYLADGSIGIGSVLREYLDHRHDDGFALAAEQALRTAQGQFFVEPGLFYGRAGMILHLSGVAGCESHAAAQIRRLSWHALTYAGELAYPGEELLRLSMDLASGTAGVLLAVSAALGDEPVGLPFLTHSPDVRAAERGDRPVLAERR